MKILYTLSVFWMFLAFCFGNAVSAQTNSTQNSKSANVATGAEDYLTWTSAQAENIGKSMRTNGKTGGAFDFRGIHTDRAINYKLRATLLTPEVIRATARLEQIRNRLSDEETRKLVSEADAAGDLVVMVEIDPLEGSGVIPLDWRVFLQPKGVKPGASGAVVGIKSPQLSKLKALAGVARRDYDYDVFWVAFPLVDKNKKSLFADHLSEFDLFVGIYNKEGHVSWRIPESIKQKIKVLSQ
ncbi:MAG: hypothetical protein M3367_02730 [Acidobacteriota bacterium]|nr:hypothetical protein [Acidobacteriota bacterium]